MKPVFGQNCCSLGKEQITIDGAVINFSPCQTEITQMQNEGSQQASFCEGHVTQMILSDAHENSAWFLSHYEEMK